MSSKKRFAINGFAQVFAFLVSLGITFFLTPYIVGKLGAAAYGFVGLASNFVGYIQIITIALNSMAGRFITISVHQNRMEDARKYFSSVFYSNIILVGIINIISLVILYYLEYIINIPDNLIADVKLLFGLIFLNFFISIVFNVYNVSTFITNRLDLSSIRSIIANVLKAVFLVGLFYFFDPALWFIGLATVISTIYIIITNIHFRRSLTPDLYIGKKYFDIKAIKELLAAGSWNIISKLNTLLSKGFDLLLANLFIGSAQMGVLSITRRIPELTLTLYERINAIYAPPWTKLHAQGKVDEFHREIQKSIRFFGLISTIPTAFIFVFSDFFYQLWMPSQDAHLLYILTVAACIDLPFAMPLQPIYNIYPITNKVRANSLFGLGLFSLTFVIVFLGVYLFDDKHVQMLVIATTSAAFNLIKALTFLPLYGAHCVKIKARLLYMNTVRSVIAFVVLLIPLFLLKEQIQQVTWLTTGLCGLATTALGLLIGLIIIYNKEDRKELHSTFSKVMSKLKRN